MEQFDNKYLTCGKCGEMLSIELLKGGYVHYKCDCSNEGEILLQELMDKSKKSANSMIPKCKTHSKEYSAYCSTCKKHLCVDCQDQHQKIQLNSLTHQVSIEEIQSQIAEVTEMLKERDLALKDRLVRRLKQELDKVEYTFKRTDTINKNMFSYIENLIDCYLNTSTHPNYHLVNNIKEIQFNTDEFYLNGETLFEHVNSFVKYLETNQVFKVKDYPESTVPSKINIQTMKTVKSFPFNAKIFIPLKDGRIAILAEYDSTAYFIDGKNFEIVKRLTEKKGYFHTIGQLPDGKFVTASSEKKLAVWEEKDSEFTKLYETSIQYGQKVIPLTQGRLALAEISGNLNIFDCKGEFKKIAVFTETHLGELNSIIQLKDGRLVSGGGVNDDDVIEDVVKFYNLETYTCQNENTVFGLNCYSQKSMVEYKNKLLVGGYGGFVVIDLKTYVKELTINEKGIEGVLSVYPLDDDTILMGCHSSDSDGGKLVQFSSGYKPIHTLTLEKYSGVNDIIQINHTTIMISSGKQSVIYTQ